MRVSPVTVLREACEITGLNGLLVRFASPNANGVLDRAHEDLAVANLAGLGRLQNGFNSLLTCWAAITSSILIFGRKSTVYSLPR